MAARAKKGFSLGEILVAVAIVAVIAAVVIPVVGGQLNKGESARLSNDLINIRTAVEQFLADVRRYPSGMAQLQTKPSALTASDTGANNTGQFTALQVARWKGPYMTKDFSTTGISGYSAEVTSLFSVCNGTAAAPVCTANPSGQRYLTIQVSGLSSSEAAEIDAAMDDGVTTTGQIRFVVSTGISGTLYYLAVPIQ